MFLGVVGFVFPVTPVDFGNFVADFVLHLLFDEDVAEIVERDDGFHLCFGNQFVVEVAVGDGRIDSENGADVHGNTSSGGEVVHDGVEVAPVAVVVALPLQGAEVVVVVVNEIERLGIEGGEFPDGVVG